MDTQDIAAAQPIASPAPDVAALADQRPPQPTPAFPAWMTRAAATVLIVWALGALLGEALAQVACALAILFSIVTLRARPALPPRQRRVVQFAVALAAWQALSPLVTWLLGIHPELPPLRRYGQIFDTAAIAALVCVVQFGVPWRTLVGICATGWLGHTIAALFQHFGLWPAALIEWTSYKANPSRLYENFAAPGDPVRHAGAGIYYHRLKLAHHAVAFFGPALALVGLRGNETTSEAVSTSNSNAKSDAAPKSAWVAGLSASASIASRLRATGIFFALLLAACVYLTYARASFGALLVMLSVGLIFLFGRRSLVPILAVLFLTVAVVALSPAWQQRFTKLSGTWVGQDRHFAMTAGLTLAREHPLTGVGFGNYQRAVMLRIDRPAEGQPPGPRFDKRLSGMARYLNHDLISLDAHNVLLTVFAETGLVGLILYVLLQLSLFRALWERHREGALAATAAFVSLVGFHCLGAVHYLPFHTGVFLTFSLIWGLGLAPARSAGDPTPRPI
ncbi:MAG: O-antigen ligase family protein [Myxococcales bacterium]|nr:O-antigen ligase family protein [Myxococcales bacterium]